MHPALTLAAKDLRQRLRDRSAVMLAVVVPLVLAAIFSVLFGPSSTPRAFEYGVVDADGSAMTRGFTTEVLGALEDAEVAEVVAVEDVAAARGQVRDGDLDAAFLLPAGFDAGVRGDQPVTITVVGSPDSVTATSVARSVARSYVEGLNAVRVAVAAIGSSGVRLSPQDIEQVAEQTVHGVSPVVLADVSAGARVLDAKTYFAAGMAVFFLLFTVQFGVSSLIDERAEGTLSRLLAAPVPRWSILAGKLLTSVVLGVASLTVLVLATSLLLGAAWGNPLAVGALVLCGVLAATGITAVVASTARTAEQAGSWQAVVAVSLGLLGGAFFPIQQSGSFLATASLITPHAWFMQGLANLSGGGGLGVVAPACAALLVMAAATGAIALARIDRVVAP
jgi:ABC-2 type transport system permease protein